MPKQSPEYPINEIRDFATRVDLKQALPVLASKMRGLVNRKSGTVAERDLGTIHRFGVYPIRPNTFKVVSGAANNGSGLIRITTSTSHGFSTDDIIYLAEIGGTVEANNIYKIVEVAGQPTKFDLVGSTFTNAWTSGGICTDTPIDIFKCFILTDPNTNTEYEVVVGVDQNTKTRFYIWSGTAWIELTQKINAVINGAPSAPGSITTTQTVTISTPTDENGAVYTLGNDTLNGYVVYNTTKGTASFVLDSTSTTIVIPHNITIAPFSWVTTNALVFFKCTGIYDGFNYSNGASPHVRNLVVEAKKKMTIFYADNSGSSLVRKDPLALIYQDASRGLFPSVSAGVKATGTITFNTPTVDVSTVTVNGVVFYYVTTITNPYTHFRNATELAAVLNGPTVNTVVSGSGTGPVTVTAVTAGAAGNSITLATNGGFTLSGATLAGGSDGTATGRITLPIGFYLEKAYFTLGFGQLGTIASPKLGTSASSSSVIGDGIFVSTVFSETTNALSFNHVRCYITAVYRGYEESDPICQIIIDGSTSAQFPTPTISMYCDPSVINKDLTGFRLYVAAKTNGTASQSDWIEDPEEYLLAEEKDVDGDDNWSYNNSSAYCYYVTFTQIIETLYPQLQGAAANNIRTNLNHAPNTARTALKPLFGIKVNRDQGGVQIVDQDDQTLRSSSYDGDKVHEDDNYAEVPTDDDSRIQIIALNGDGAIMEMVLKGGTIFIHRQAEIELYDLNNARPDYLFEQNVAQNGIFESPYGDVFASTLGLRLLPVLAGKAKTLNLLWDNLYDGSYRIDDDSASYITEAYRQAIVGGHYSNLDEEWFAYQVNMDAVDGGGSEYVVSRYSWKQSKWIFRKFHLGNSVAPNLSVSAGQSKITSLMGRKDGTMMIVTKRGLFKYPYTGTYRFQDGVYSDGRSSDRGIPTEVQFSLGGLANAIPHATLEGIKVNHKGKSTDGAGFVTIELYRNNRISPVDTKRFRVDDPPIIRKFQALGSIENSAIRIKLPDDDLDNFEDFEINQIVVPYIPAQVAEVA